MTFHLNHTKTAWVRRFGYHYIFFYLLLLLFAYVAAAHVDSLSVGSDDVRLGVGYLPLLAVIVIGIIAACVPAALDAGDALEEGAVWAITLIGIACFITVNLLAWSEADLLLCFIPIYVAGWVKGCTGNWERCGRCSVLISFGQINKD